VDLTGWALDGGISYKFNTGKTLAPGGYLVVAKDVAALRTTYPAIDIVGDYSGHLSSDDEIILEDPFGNPANQVHYLAAGAGRNLRAAAARAWNCAIPRRTTPKPRLGRRATNPEIIVADLHLPHGGTGQRHPGTRQPVERFCAWSVEQWRMLGGTTSVWWQSPTNNPVQLISNGNFENGLTGWRWWQPPAQRAGN